MGERRRHAPDSIARGVALFLSGFLIMGAVGRAFGDSSENIWLIDLSMIPFWLGGVLSALSGVALAGYALAPVMGRWRRIATMLLCSLLAAAAAFNAGAFFAARADGRIASPLPVPFSIFVSFVIGGIVLGLVASAPSAYPRGVTFGMVVTLCIVLVLFPLAQVFFFGTTDYRREADAAVVLGARVYEGGVLSQSLRDRVDTGVVLYEEGLVPRLVMSGGIGESGVDEAAAMRDYAVVRGVPFSAVSVDSSGTDTQASARNSRTLLGPGASVLAVSQFYHLPRVKMAFRMQGIDAYTVPARGPYPIVGTPAFVIREVPAFWWYWLRGIVRDLVAGLESPSTRPRSVEREAL
jgi:vancomycin permeability regulator SanA